MHLRRNSLLVIALSLTAGLSHAQMGGRGFGGTHEDVKILKRYDKDGDGVLNAAERRGALADFGFDLSKIPAAVVPAAKRLTPTQVRQYGNESLFDPAVLRTVFLSFDTPTWEDELAVFKDSDVKIPATMVIDGKTLRDVGVSFRGQTSFRVTSAGQKRSLNLDIDFRHKEQNVLGATRLTLLNSAGDPSFLRTVLYLDIARHYYPAFGANYVRVVINGENWGVYVNQQAADAAFTRVAGHGSSGPIWKVPGSPGARGGLEYWGEDPAAYQRVFDLTHKGGRTTTESWQALIQLCRVLNQTPPDKLPAQLALIMDVDGALRFLAVDNVLMNTDGYYTRASDYNLFMDSQGKFRFVVHDVNEVMRPPEGGRRWRGGGGGGMPVGDVNEMSLSPLAGADQPGKVLLNRLLAVPEYRQRYLGYIREINDKWMNWDRIGPLAAKYQALIGDDVRRDDRKLYSTDAYNASLTTDMGGGGNFGPTGTSLKSFVEKRHAFLLGALGDK